jgi:hypothetical protein
MEAIGFSRGTRHGADLPDVLRADRLDGCIDLSIEARWRPVENGFDLSHGRSPAGEGVLSPPPIGARMHCYERLRFRPTMSGKTTQLTDPCIKS